MRLTDQTPAMWKEVPHNRVSNRVVGQQGQHLTHTSHTLGQPHMGGRTPDTTKSQPKDMLHRGVPNTQQP